MNFHPFLSIFAALLAAGPASWAEDEDKEIHVEYQDADWRDVLVRYKALTGLEAKFATGFPRWLKAQISVPAVELSKSQTIDVLGQAFRKQCGIILSPNPKSKFVTVSYFRPAGKRTRLSTPHSTGWSLLDDHTHGADSIEAGEQALREIISQCAPAGNSPTAAAISLSSLSKAPRFPESIAPDAGVHIANSYEAGEKILSEILSHPAFPVDPTKSPANPTSPSTENSSKHR